ncbi:SDR family NAD(P)-dependent oxidoreductase [Oscillatoria sp. FACHB-1406]|uniref:SDR family NAD(P)-dependent oxidoreductase n=1 Tax=Oscillatoria sp. FACHB-1406 TaxID=2692846 RepID=UPI0016862BB9|nr:SDR family NAD(P)-dependent oxidoreductase [Oscillatoria sp. FACHB-1406]MBD2577294.1 SDR family NAD(P)-dependent oxidoreductase [Oscillatoria sp. FACHB-1406]
MNIQGKVALVTGASRGIGRAIALELARGGIERLILVARDRTRLAEIAQEIKALGVEAVPLAVDLTKPKELDIAIAGAWRSAGPIHLLVNCAGVAHQSSFLDSKFLQVQEELSLNVLGTYGLTRLVARRMAARREGTIVNVSSLMGKVAAPTMATYSATKFAIVGLTQALRHELAPHNIHVTALLPTLTETDMVRDLHRFRGIVPTSPERVARSLLDGLAKDSAEILVGWQSHLIVWCQRLAPWLLAGIFRLSAPNLEERNFLSWKPLRDSA